MAPWRDGRAVEGSCLENSQVMSLGGSNPSPSATTSRAAFVCRGESGEARRHGSLVFHERCDEARACALEATGIAREIGDNELLVNAFLTKGGTAVDPSGLEAAREVSWRHGWKFYHAYSSCTPAFSLP
jgi:hypothetical protein